MSSQFKYTKYYRKLAKKTGNTCILCGVEFESNSVVNREHLVPKSKTSALSKRDVRESVMPAHVMCNTYRGSASLVKAMVLFAKSRTRDPVAFSRWANSAVRTGKFKLADPPNMSRSELMATFGKTKRLSGSDLEEIRQRTLSSNTLDGLRTWHFQSAR